MTPTEIAQQALQVQVLQAWITGIAIILGPLSGVLFTLWVQRRKDKKESKARLFLTLMGERKHYVISHEMAKAYNTIDVVFADNQKVRHLWHQYYALLSQPYSEQRAHAWLELLSEMAKDVGYKALTQVDLDKFYLPQGHADEIELRRKVMTELARLLETSEAILTKPKTPAAPTPAAVPPPSITTK